MSTHNDSVITELMNLVETHFPALKCDRFCECGKLESQHVMRMWAHGNFCPDLVLQRFSPLRGTPLPRSSGAEGREAPDWEDRLPGSTTIDRCRCTRCGNFYKDCDCPKPDPREELYERRERQR